MEQVCGYLDDYNNFHKTKESAEQYNEAKKLRDEKDALKGSLTSCICGLLEANPHSYAVSILVDRLIRKRDQREHLTNILTKLNKLYV